MARSTVNSSAKSQAAPAPVAPTERIGASGGWVEREGGLGRPKTRLYTMAALLWIFPSGGALFLLAPSAPDWLGANGVFPVLRRISFEQWIALIILLTHLVFAGLAWHFRRTERWQKETFPEDNPNP